MMAIAIIAETDLIAALPKKLVLMHAARFQVVGAKMPLPPRRDLIRVVASRAALMDSGVAWLFGLICDAVATRASLGCSHDS
jgi:hypothetical protein